MGAAARSKAGWINRMRDRTGPTTGCASRKTVAAAAQVAVALWACTLSFQLAAQLTAECQQRLFTQDRMKELIIISAIGSDRTGLVFDVTRVILECGGNVLESRMTALGSEFAMLLLVSGNWHTLSKLESEFRKLSESANINISIRRTEARSARPETVTYSVDVVCLDQPGVVFNLAGFFSSRGIDIGDVTTRHFAAAHTGASMFSVQMVIHVPSKIHIAALREEFMELCDHMNLDAILEPFKA